MRNESSAGARRAGFAEGGAPVDILGPLVSFVTVSSNLHSFYPRLSAARFSCCLSDYRHSHPKFVKRKNANYAQEKWNRALTIQV